MVFVGFVDGSKAIRYYDAKAGKVYVSRNVAWNENDEPQDLSSITEIPGLRSEGEYNPPTQSSNVSQPESAPQPSVEKDSRLSPLSPLPESRETSPSTAPEPNPVHTRPVRSTRTPIDYRQANDPLARPQHRGDSASTTAQTDPY